MHILSVEGRWNVITPTRERGSGWTDDDDPEEEGALRKLESRVMGPEAGKPDDKPGCEPMQDMTLKRCRRGVRESVCEHVRRVV